MVIAEGSWAMTDGYAFNMGFTVNFENATAVYDMARPAPLVLYENGKAPAEIPVSTTMGYDLEIDYMLECIKQGRRPRIVTLRDAMNTLRIIEAETASVRSGRREPVEP
jgi:predicted dehydrogenase